MTNRTVCGLVAAMILIAGAAHAADAQVEVPYPFAVQRAVAAGQAFKATKGDIFYSEKATGQPAMFLTAALALSSDEITIDPSDPLTEFSYYETDQPFFGRAKHIEVKAYCPDKVSSETFNNSAGKVRRTRCFVDRDGDRRFDEWVTGFARVRENFGSDDTPDGITHLFGVASSMEPVGYTMGTALPAGGKEGVIELRYGGVCGARALITVAARFVDAPSPAYQSQIEFDRPKDGPVEVVIPNPVLASDGFRHALGHPVPSPDLYVKSAFGKSQPIPEMRLSITQADAKGVSGSVTAGFPDWVWYIVPCEPKASTTGAAGQSQTVATAACDVVTFRMGMALLTLSPGAPGRFAFKAMTRRESR